MDVFISWSGERSRAAAEALRGWLPKIINAIKPWLSSEDIDKGSRWGSDVASRLEAAKAGIICLTPGNLHSDWILFEAGALSKTLQNTFVCPLLIGLEPSDVKPPLAQFQATKAQKDDILKLLKTLNSALGTNALQEAHIDEAFDVWWPRLESQIKSLPAEEFKTKTHRPDRELLEEVLALVRNQSRPDASPPQQPVQSVTIGKKLPYDLSQGAVIQETQSTITRHGLILDKVTRLVPEKANSRRYQFALKSGPTFIFEVAEGLTDQMTGKELNSLLDDALQKAASANKNNSGAQ
jgi:TIR domain